MEDAMAHHQTWPLSDIGVPNRTRTEKDALAFDCIEPCMSRSDVPPVAGQYE